MNTKESEYYSEVSAYIESQKIVRPIGDSYHSSYNEANTTAALSDDAIKLMAIMDINTLVLWVHVINSITRGHDPVSVCTVYLKQSELKSLMCKPYYYKALKDLINYGALIETSIKYRFIINIKLIHKLYKPKYEEK